MNLQYFACIHCFIVQILAEGERTFKISDATLRTFVINNMANLEKSAKGKFFKALQSLYKAQERTEGRTLQNLFQLYTR